MKTMNSILLTALASLFAMLSCGCSSDSEEGNGNDTDVAVTLSQTEVAVTALSVTVPIQVQTTAKEWTAYVLDSNDTWLKARANTATSTIDIVIEENTAAERTGTVVFKSGTTRKNITVKQAAPLTVTPTSLYFTQEGGEKTISVSYDGEWNVTSSATWATCKKEGSTLVVTTTENTAEKRNASITISTADEKAVVEVEQGGDEAFTCPLEGYHLVWNDEFSQEGNELSRDWTHEVKGSGWVNNELQNYVNTKSPRGTRVTEVTNGTLKINCFKEDGKVYSGRVYAKLSSGWQYGYFEAAIKLPKGKGTWPAFWMMPVTYTSWPHCGEIDIMEEVGVDPNIVSSSIHCTSYNHMNSTQKTKSTTCNGAEGEFHVYALEWTADYIQTYVDGKKLFYFPNDKKNNDDTWPFHVPFYPILNLAWGGDWGGYNGVDESKLPLTMEVDYLRVFQKN